jgi:T6SS, Transcription factor, DNA binding domain
VIPITRLPPGLANRSLERNIWSLGPAVAEEEAERLIERRGRLFRLHILEAPGHDTPCVVLPLDRLFDIRVAAAMRLWRGLTGRAPGHDPSALPATRRERLVLALRALDARVEKASYRDIAEALFGARRLPERSWKTHDLRDRTIRLARLGRGMMQGGYRRLLLYPFRGRI